MDTVIKSIGGFKIEKCMDCRNRVINADINYKGLEPLRYKCKITNDEIVLLYCINDTCPLEDYIDPTTLPKYEPVCIKLETPPEEYSEIPNN